MNTPMPLWSALLSFSTPWASGESPMYRPASSLYDVQLSWKVWCLEANAAMPYSVLWSARTSLTHRSLVLKAMTPLLNPVTLRSEIFTSFTGWSKSGVGEVRSCSVTTQKPCVELASLHGLEEESGGFTTVSDHPAPRMVSSLLMMTLS